MTACQFRNQASRSAGLASTERRLHLIDIENIAGCPLPEVALVRQCRRRFIEVARPGDSDLVVVACSPLAAENVMFEWPGAQRIIREGPDGADLALLGAWEDFASVRAGFSGVSIASGDHIFAPLAARIAEAGIEVTVISQKNSLSHDLRFAANRILCFNPRDTGPTIVLPKWRTSRKPNRSHHRARAELAGGRVL